MTIFDLIHQEAVSKDKGKIDYLAPKVHPSSIPGEMETVFLEVDWIPFNTVLKQKDSKVTSAQESELAAVGVYMDSLVYGKLTEELREDNIKAIYSRMKLLGYQNPTIKPIRFAKLKELITRLTGYRFGKVFKKAEDISKHIMKNSNLGFSLTKMGAYNYIIVNAKIGSALLDSASMDINLSPVTAFSTIHRIGTIYGNISVFVNSYQSWEDNTIVYGHKNVNKGPGIYYIKSGESFETVNNPDQSKTYRSIEKSIILNTPNSEKYFLSEEIQLHKKLI